MYGGPQQPAFVNAVRNLSGIALSPDINGGDPNGVSYTPLVCFSIASFIPKADVTTYRPSIGETKDTGLHLQQHTLHRSRMSANAGLPSSVNR